MITNNVSISGNGLWDSSTYESDFLRKSQSYLPSYDPRLPRHATLGANLSSPFANAEITVSDINLFTITSSVIATSTVNGIIDETMVVPVNDVSDIQLGYGVISSNIDIYDGVSIVQIFESNTSILIGALTTNTVIASDEILNFPIINAMYCSANVASNVSLSTDLVVPLTNINDININDSFVSATITSSLGVRVKSVFENNSSVLITPLTSNKTVTKGEKIYISNYSTKGALRIKEEVIHYDHAWASNNTLSGLTRSVGNTVNCVDQNGTIVSGSIITFLGSV